MARPIPLISLSVPLRPDGRGGYRVAGARIPLDVVVHAYQDGASPESLAADYPTLALADIYTVIAYYLANREAMDAHLTDREEEARELQQWAEARHPAPLRAHLQAIRDLLARR